MSKREAVTSAGSVYLEYLVGLAAGYLYWLIISKITTPQTLGTASAIISVATILSVAASFGIPPGVQRFMAKTYLRGKISDAKTYFEGSVLLILCGIAIAGFVIIFAHQWILGTNVGSALVYMTIILTGSTSMTAILRSFVISSLSKSVWLPIASATSTVARIAVGVCLVLFGWATLGVIIGFTLAPVVTIAILGMIYTKTFREQITTEKEKGVTLKDTFSDIIRASVPTWVPLIVNAVGAHLGTIVVYGSHGADQAAVYFIALSLVMGLVTLASALYSVSYSVLSAMDDGRKKFAWRTIKVTMIISSPLSLSLFWFAFEILSFFGRSYGDGEMVLQILLLSVFPTLITTGITTLVYSRGSYRDVLMIGLASNIPRPLLYILLVPFLDSTGAALSYTVGSFIGLLYAIKISQKVGMVLFWKQIFLMLAIPAAIAFALKFSHINFIVGILITILVSTILYMRFSILTEPDIKDSMMVLPHSVSNWILSVVKVIGRKN